MGKNKVTITIESCNQCPNATVKYNRKIDEDEMFCQTETSCIMLKESWGYRPIPDWCPRLNRQKNFVENVPKFLALFYKYRSNKTKE